jgi:hypothetical protein
MIAVSEVPYVDMSVTKFTMLVIPSQRDDRGLGATRGILIARRVVSTLALRVSNGLQLGPDLYLPPVNY